MKLYLIALAILTGVTIQMGGCVSTALQITGTIFGAGSQSAPAIPPNEVEPMTETTAIFDFSDPAAAAAWTIVNDGVMGGVSQSRITATDTGTMRFTGTISFENNGGFASTQTYFASPLDLSAYAGVALRVLGDGKQYGVYLREGRGRVAYQATFQTVAGEWQEVRLPFSAFLPTFFGSPTVANPLNPATINAMTVIIEYSQEGTFALDIAQIAAYTLP